MSPSLLHIHSSPRAVNRLFTNSVVILFRGGGGGLGLESMEGDDSSRVRFLVSGVQSQSVRHTDPIWFNVGPSYAMQDQH